MWAVIGGSGFEKFAGVDFVEDLPRETPFGLTSAGFKRVCVGEHELLFLPRHGPGHGLMPSEINARANIYALKAHGVTKLLAFYATGSLQADLAPGHCVVPNQFINRTHRCRTFCSEGLVANVSLANPTWTSAQEFLRKQDFDFPMHFDKTYVCIEGPAFSTQAEARMNRANGADIVGMTAFPEYPLAREAGLCYLPLCFVTDYDCWDDDLEHVTIQQVIEIMSQHSVKGMEVLKRLLDAEVQEDEHCTQGGIANCMISSPELLKSEKFSWLEVFSSNQVLSPA